MKILSLILMTLSVTLGAKEWVVLPGQSRGVRVSTLIAPPASVESSNIPALNAHHIHTDSDNAPAVAAGYTVQEMAPVRAFSSDPRFAEQWYLNDIAAQQAWPLEAAGDGVLVAVLDTGVDATHPDLLGKVVGGENFVDGGSWADDQWHGTFCASLIAAQRDNSVGMAGVAASARILAVKVLDKDGAGYDYSVAQGIVWAADQGAKVISISLGGSAPSAVMEAAVNYAIGKNVLIVAAAGNDGGQTVYYPASIPGVLSVGSSSSTGGKASYSTYNSFVSMVAPGGDGNGLSDILGAVPGGGYSFASGTSFSAPLVAAAAAAYLHTFPAQDAAHAFASLTGTALPLDPSYSWTPQTGWGELNMAALMNGDVTPRVYGPMPVNTTVTEESAPVPVGAFAAAPRNSQVTAAFAVLKDGDTELLRQTLGQQGSTLQWGGSLQLPEWNGLSSRTLQVYYQAQNAAGTLSPMVAAGSLVQASRYNVSFDHDAPARLAVGKDYTAHLVQTPARPACSNWSMKVKAADGSSRDIAGQYDDNGALFFVVPGNMVQGKELDYSFTATDSEGKQVLVHSGKDYQVALYMPGVDFEARPYLNPGTSLCLRVSSGEAAEGEVMFFNTAGELVGKVHASLNPGENLVCLETTVASGMYFGMANSEGGNNRKMVKLAIKR